MGKRVREKLDKAKSGEGHHILEEDEAHWVQNSGIQIGHVSDAKTVLVKI